ncbi:MAG: hypothetical protein JWM59_7 [Verrucomicrobiales bacterium]|nr:hypothetical protein [Verrucomicrobiales bacterium]
MRPTARPVADFGILLLLKALRFLRRLHPDDSGDVGQSGLGLRGGLNGLHPVALEGRQKGRQALPLSVGHDRRHEEPIPSHPHQPGGYSAPSETDGLFSHPPGDLHFHRHSRDPLRQDHAGRRSMPHIHFQPIALPAPGDADTRKLRQLPEYPERFRFGDPRLVQCATKARRLSKNAAIII